MKQNLAWLALRLMRKQKLRTAVVFCGILFSGFLLDLFGSLGYYFWNQVHDGASGDTVYDPTQRILTALACILLILVAVCAATLLCNMLLLSFAQKWRSLSRLAALGASRNAILFLVMTELCILYGIAAPFSRMFSFLAAALVTGSWQMPLWVLAGIYIWLFAAACICGMRPAIRAIRELPGMPHTACAAAGKPIRESPHCQMFGLPCMACAAAGKPIRKSQRCQIRRLFRTGCPATRQPRRKLTVFSGNHSFAAFMARKYYMANRKHYHRISLTVIAAIILYIPPSYLIHANLQAQRSQLHAKYGIQYRYAPSSLEELEGSIKEYQHLADVNGSGNSMLCVELHGIASVESGALNEKLLSVLRKAGWQDDGRFLADSVLYVVEDAYFDAWYDDTCHAAYPGAHIPAGSMQKPSAQAAGRGKDTYTAVLVDRYINRSGWKENADTLYQETPLLKADAKEGLNSAVASDIQPGSAVRVYYGQNEGFQAVLGGQPDDTPWIDPNTCADSLPDGISFTGNISVVLPLCQLPNICSAMQSCGNVQISGFFQDNDETLFDALAQRLGADGMGRLIYSRRDYEQWYDSMREIHIAMAAISALLFFIALLNIFSTLIFQYMERKHSLAVLWSLGQTRYGLLKILALESMQSFIRAMAVGIPASCALCCMIYRVYRNVWRVGFALPLGQIAVLVAAALLSGVAAMTVSMFLMKSQGFQSAWMDSEQPLWGREFICK